MSLSWHCLCNDSSPVLVHHSEWSCIISHLRLVSVVNNIQHSCYKTNTLFGKSKGAVAVHRLPRPILPRNSKNSVSASRLRILKIIFWKTLDNFKKMVFNRINRWSGDNTESACTESPVAENGSKAERVNGPLRAGWTAARLSILRRVLTL